MAESGWGSRRNVAPYVGATIVTVIGFGGILMTAIMVFPDAAFETLMLVSAGFVGFLALLWAMRPSDDLPSAVYGWVLNRKPKEDELQGYEPLTKRTKRMDKAKQAPPSVDDVRDIKQSSNNWVPTGATAPKRIARSRRLGSEGAPKDPPRGERA